MNYAIYPPEEIIEDARLRMPTSKSVALRALVMAAMVPGAGCADVAAVAAAQRPLCDDVRLCAQALERYLEAPAEEHTFDLDMSGAALRFLTAYFACRPGSRVTLTGSPRLLERPMGILVEALRACGARIECQAGEGRAPLAILGRQLRGGELTIDATVSSQFLSALLMTAPAMTAPLVLRLEGEPVSEPYILLTLHMMGQRGVEAEREPLRLEVRPGAYRAVAPEGEGDWSATACWYEVTAISAGWLTLEGLDAASRQPDARAPRAFGQLGVVTAPSEEVPGALDLQPSPEVFGRVDEDLCDTPDLAPALVCACCAVGIPFHLTGLQTLALKESDRLGALVEEMARIGCELQRPAADTLVWEGRRHPIAQMPLFDSHGDHRLAMALAPVALAVPGIVVRDVECVSKSYPEYWDHLRQVGFTLKEAVISEEGAGEAPREAAPAAMETPGATPLPGI